MTFQITFGSNVSFSGVQPKPRKNQYVNSPSRSRKKFLPLATLMALALSGGCSSSKPTASINKLEPYNIEASLLTPQYKDFFQEIEKIKEPSVFDFKKDDYYEKRLACIKKALDQKVPAPFIYIEAVRDINQLLTNELKPAKLKNFLPNPNIKDILNDIPNAKEWYEWHKDWGNKYPALKENFENIHGPIYLKVKEFNFTKVDATEAENNVNKLIADYEALMPPLKRLYAYKREIFN